MYTELQQRIDAMLEAKEQLREQGAKQVGAEGGMGWGGGSSNLPAAILRGAKEWCYSQGAPAGAGRRAGGRAAGKGQAQQEVGCLPLHV